MDFTWLIELINQIPTDAVTLVWFESAKMWVAERLIACSALLSVATYITIKTKWSAGLQAMLWLREKFNLKLFKFKRRQNKDREREIL